MTMRKYKYRAILHTEDGTNFDFVYDVYGTNKENAIKNIDVCFPCSVKSIKRVNITDKKRSKKFLSMAFVDMGQCF